MAILVMILGACSGGTGTGNSGSDSIPADSTAVDAHSQELLTDFPDTVYPSAKAVKATIVVHDSVNTGRLTSLADMYADAPGIMTFRGGPRRDARYNGHVAKTPSEIAIDWEFVTDEDYTPTDYGRWGGGTGWTGQPIYVQWPDSCVAAQRRAGAMTADFGPREIIVGSLACKLYFINFDTGKASRQAIDTGGNPIKGSPALDPTLNGNLYVGQGVPANRPFGAFVVDLAKHRITDFTAEDSHALRRWGAYDSSPLRIGQFLFRPGENGIIYKYTVDRGKLRPHTTLRYTVTGASPGIEASMAAYRNYGFTGDNHGNVLCFNLHTMQPVWHYALGDDIDATPVVAEEDGHPYLYVCCEVDRRGHGPARMTKLDAVDGHQVWCNEIEAQRFDRDGKHFDGGYYSTPLLGMADCDSLLYAHCVLNNDEERNGVFVAINRHTGKESFRRELRTYGWSSPVAMTDPTGKMYVVAADCYGNVYVMRGNDGQILVRRQVGHNFESSPVVVGNSLVVGSRGNTIYKLSVK